MRDSAVHHMDDKRANRKLGLPGSFVRVADFTDRWPHLATLSDDCSSQFRGDGDVVVFGDPPFALLFHQYQKKFESAGFHPVRLEDPEAP